MKAETLPPAFGRNIFYFHSGIAWTDEWFEIFFLKKKSLVRAAVNTEMMFLPHHRTLDFGCDVRPQHRHLW